jgi:hypothetical protein
MMKHYLVAAGLIASSLAVAGDSMPVAEQNALVQKYCAVCHNDAHVNGGLTLEHFDAAHADPSVAAMLVSKLRDGGAIGAAGVPVPDKATQDALLSALLAEATGATSWTVNRAQHPATLSATIAQEVVPAAAAPKRYKNDHGAPDAYRLTVTCNSDTHEGEMLVAWSPMSPTKENVMSAVVDGKMPFTYQVEGSEKMFKGAVGTMGTGATILNAKIDGSGVSKLPMPLPEQTLTISDLFPGETVVFSFGDLPQAARQELSKCFTGSGVGQ